MWLFGLVILITLTSPWWVFLASSNLMLAIFVVVAVGSYFFKDNKQWLFPVFILGLLVWFGYTNGLEKYQVSQKINTRWQLYPIGQTKIAGTDVPQKIAVWFESRTEGKYLEWYINKLALVIDPSYYFFGNHPHERVGVAEKERFYWWLWPFAIIGALSAHKKLLWIGFVMAVVGSVLVSESDLGFVAVYAVLSIFIGLGISFLCKKIEHAYGKYR